MFLDFKTTTVRSQCCYFTHVEQTALHCKQLLCDEKQHLQPNGKYIKIPEGRTVDCFISDLILYLNPLIETPPVAQMDLRLA